MDAKQAVALEHLLLGATATAAAAAAGVDRRTVCRWQHKDVTFRAALNRERRESWEAAQKRVASLRELAIDAVERALHSGDARIGLAILRGLGFLQGEPPQIGSDDVKLIGLSVEREERQLAEYELYARLGVG